MKMNLRRIYRAMNNENEAAYKNGIAEVVFKNGIAIEKGIVLTRDFLNANQELATSYLNLWLLYPDLMLDAIQDSADAVNFHLLPF